VLSAEKEIFGASQGGDDGYVFLVMMVMLLVMVMLCFVFCRFCPLHTELVGAGNEHFTNSQFGRCWK